MAFIPIPRVAQRPPVSINWRAWQYSGGKRDVRLDFLRGFAMLAMIANHIGGESSWLYVVTGGNRFFISAAEVFVFISGLVMGIIYAGLIARQGLRAALLKTTRRAWTLYLLTVSLSLALAVLVTRFPVEWTAYLTPTTWPELVWGLVTTQRTYMFTDVLLLYAFLVLAAGPLLALLARGYTGLVLLLSWGLWALWQVAPDSVVLPWPIIDNGTFHFSAWQVLFVMGLVVGFHRRALEKRLAHLNPLWLTVGAGALLTLAVGLYLTHLAPLSGLGQPDALNALLFDKANVRPGRLLVFATFMVFAYSLLTLAWTPFKRALGWLILPLGQKSLTAYTLHLFVGVLLALTLQAWAGPEADGGLNALIQLTGIALVWGLVHGVGHAQAAVRRLPALPLPDPTVAVARVWVLLRRRSLSEYSEDCTTC